VIRPGNGANRSGLLDIEIDAAGADGVHPVRIERDGAVTRTTFVNPFSKDGLIKAAARVDRGLITEVTTKAIGSELFHALFADGSARSVFDQSRGEGRNRLRFITGDGATAAIPWELLYDSKREEYLAHSGTISRWIRVSADIATPLRQTLVDEPVRTLVLLANPRSDQLDLDAEAAAIQEAFAQAVRHDRAEKVQILPQTTLDRLQSTITQAANENESFHIIHFAGHTGQQPGSPLPYLLLEPDEHHNGEVDPETFANVVAGSERTDLRLVFLNACGSLQTGEARSGRLFPGFASELMLRGVPAIIGTQSPVLDTFATRVAGDFYRTLLDGSTVDEALSQVRELLHGDRAGQFSNFGIPVCYISDGDGRVVTGPKNRWVRWRESLTPRSIVAMILFALFTLIPGVWWYLDRFVPDPPPLIVGDYRVGVAEFDVVDPLTELGSSLASQLSASLYNRLSEPDVLNCGGTSGELGSGGRPFGCQGPTTAGVIEGDSGEERARAAAEYAETVNANMVVYGTMEESDRFLRFTPEIYLTGLELVRAEELAGPHTLQVRIGPVASTTQIRAFRGQVELLAQDLGDLSIALSYYSDADYELALDEVDGVIERGSFDLDRSLLNLIKGNLHIKMAAAGDDGAVNSEQIVAAEGAYQESIAATPGYARGWLGLAEISYQLGRGVADCAPGSIEEAELLESIARYQRAGQEDVSPPAANVDDKAAFGIARSAACLSQAGVANRWDEARSGFTTVVEAYESGETGLGEFASESYSLIAFIDLRLAENDEDRVDALEQSIELNQKARQATNDPARVGVFAYLMADAYRQLGRHAESCAPLQVALDRNNPAAVANASTFSCG